MTKIKKIFLHSPKSYIIAIAIVIVITVIGISLNNKEIGSLINIFNIISVAGAATFLIGCLNAVAYYGGFDTFKYSFKSFRRNGVRETGDYYDYVKRTNEKKAKSELTYVPYMVVGIFVTIIAIIALEIII